MKDLSEFIKELRDTHKKLVGIYANKFYNVARSDSYPKDGLLGFEPSSYYVGITNDVSKRLSEHNAKPLYSENVGLKSMAVDVEIELSRMGFDAGTRPGNGGTDDTTFVYIYRKIPGKTIEDTND